MTHLLPLLTDPVPQTAWRLFAIADLMVLLCAGTAIHTAYRDAMPVLAWRAGWGFGWVLVVLTAAIGINTLASEPLTLGTRIVTAGITPAAVWVAWLVGVEVRQGWRASRDERRERIIARADDVAAWANHVEHAEPCANPECQRMRAELLLITRPRSA